MLTPLTHSQRASTSLSHRLFSHLHAVLLVSLIGTTTAFAAKPKWPTIPPEELSSKASPIDPEAAAEILLTKIDIDDRRFPEYREQTNYSRYKIYQPDKAEALTRMTVTGTTELFARLTLPNGKVTEFGKETIKEKTLARSSGPADNLKEKLLAIPGIEPESIIEFITIREGIADFSGASVLQDYPIQKNNFPIRHYEWKCRYAKIDEFDFRIFVVSGPKAKIEGNEKEKSISVTAENFPALHTEPHLGPRTDYCATILTSYNSRELKLDSGRYGKKLSIVMDKKAGAWAPLATIVNAVEQMKAVETKRVHSFAKELLSTETAELEKARRIHNKVQELYHTFIRLPRRELPDGYAAATGGIAYFAESPDDVLDFEKKTGPIIEDMDFYWLALALYRAAGLDAKSILLPDRSIVRFDPKQVSQLFLSDIAIRVMVNGQPMFSYPLIEQRFTIGNTRYRYNSKLRPQLRLPFGLLPWANEGQVGLVANTNKEEFIPIPFTPAPQSMIANGGVFKLDAEGTLTGQPVRRYTGQMAIDIRARLAKAPPEKRQSDAEKVLQKAYPSATVKVTKVSGIETVDEPLEITYELKWPNFATCTGSRLIFQPELFRRTSKPEFSAATRQHPVHFHAPWQEVDRIVIQVPPNFEPETVSAPTSFPGDILLCNNTYRFDAAKHALFVNRDFSSKVIDLPAAKYPMLKEWYDQLYAADQHEIVFIDKAKEAQASSATAPTP